MADFRYGGQAVLEGVVMKGRYYLAMAVRRPNGAMVLHRQALAADDPRLPWRDLPLIRGMAAVYNTLALGRQLLGRSIAIYYGRERSAPVELGWAIVLWQVLAAVTFVALPLWGLQYFPAPASQRLGAALLEGLFKLLLIAAYYILLRFIPRTRRMLAYHGAEHKAIHCLEARRPLSVDEVRGCSRLQGRCGSSLLFVHVLLTTAIMAFLPLPSPGIRLLVQGLLLPLAAGGAFEILTEAERRPHSLLWHWVVKPGLLLQRISTLEPDDRQIGVAIKALRAVTEADDVHRRERKVIPFPLSASR